MVDGFPSELFELHLGASGVPRLLNSVFGDGGMSVETLSNRDFNRFPELLRLGIPQSADWLPNCWDFNRFPELLRLGAPSELRVRGTTPLSSRCSTYHGFAGAFLKPPIPAGCITGRDHIA